MCRGRMASARPARSASEQTTSSGTNALIRRWDIMGF
jgi:hypothetical protein